MDSASGCRFKQVEKKYKRNVLPVINTNIRIEGSIS